MKKNVLILVVASICLASCNSVPADETDSSVYISDPRVKAQLKEEFRQYLVAKDAVNVKCNNTWKPDYSMVEFCIQKQMPLVKGYIKMKVVSSDYNKLPKGRLNKYQRCEQAHWGDYEMANACVESEESLSLYSAQNSD